MYAFVNVSFVKGFHEAAVQMRLAASLSQRGQSMPRHRTCMVMLAGGVDAGRFAKCWGNRGRL